MNGARSRRAGFRQRLLRREPLLGTLVKLPAAAVVEILGLSGLDFIILDTEHAPLDRAAVDHLLLAAIAVDLPVIVRLSSGAAAEAQQALDSGSVGILIPHVASAAGAIGAVSIARYAAGRGYSNSPRAGGYGTIPVATLTRAADRMTAVLCQIEDQAGVAQIDEIAAVPGVDGLVIGPADLALSLGCATPDGRAVEEAISTVQKACEAGPPTGIFLPDPARCHALRVSGMSLFIIGSDVGLLRTAATKLKAGFAP